MELVKEVFDLLLLGFVIVFRYEAALVYFKNEGVHPVLAFLILLPFSSAISIFIYWAFAIQPLKNISDKLSAGVCNFFLQRRSTRKIMLSFLSFHEHINHRKERNVHKIAEVIKRFGKFIIFVVPMIPIPFTRTGMVLATRLLDIKGAMRLILGAIAIRVAGEVYLYYTYGTSLFPFLKNFSVLQIALWLVAALLISFLGSWAGHAIRDKHFSPDRFN